jgi:hypothetical protein
VKADPVPAWEVRPTFLTSESEVDPTDAANVAKGLRIQEHLRSQGVRAVGFELPSAAGAVAITAVLVLEAPTPGQAVDTGVQRLLDAFDAEGATTNGLHEVVVRPLQR